MAVSPDALICVRPRKNVVATSSRSYSPPGAPAKMPKSAAVLPPTRLPPPPWLPLSIAARPPSRHIALALRSKTSPTFVLAWQWSRSANNGMLLPHGTSHLSADSGCSVFLLRVRRSYPSSSTLPYHRRLDFAQSARRSTVVLPLFHPMDLVSALAVRVQCTLSLNIGSS